MMSPSSYLMAPHGAMPVLRQGPALTEAPAALILVHGRGASPEDIIELAPFLGAEAFHVMAPAAANSTWYPISFLAPVHQNEPGISAGIAKIEFLVREAIDAGIPAERIVVGGFSQGACLASEFVARNPRSYGGLIVFSGGLIGPKETSRHYEGFLDGVPVFLGCSDADPHIPAWRVEETAEVLARMGASVDLRLYPNLPHTVIGDELQAGKAIVVRASQ